MPIQKFITSLQGGDIPSKKLWMKYANKQGLKKKIYNIVEVGDSLESYLQQRKELMKETETSKNADKYFAKSLKGEKDKLISAILKCIELLKQKLSQERKITAAIAKKKSSLGALKKLLNNVRDDIPNRPNEWKVLINEKKKLVAGMKKFDTNDDIDSSAKWLYIRDVRSVITIEYKGCGKTRDAVLKAGMNWYTCFLPDWHAPCVMQLKAYCDLVKKCLKKGGVVTHCYGGTGRTGVFLASYLLYSGMANNAQEAFKQIRQDYNTHAIELKAQYNALARFSDSLGKKPSMHYEDPRFNHFEGEWHNSEDYDIPEGDFGIKSLSGDKGFKKDPGHTGWKPKTTKIDNINLIAMNQFGRFIDGGREYIGENGNGFLIEEQKIIEQEFEKKEDDFFGEGDSESFRFVQPITAPPVKNGGFLVGSYQDDKLNFLDGSDKDESESFEFHHSIISPPVKDGFAHPIIATSGKNIVLSTKKNAYIQSWSNKNEEFWC